MKKYQVQYFFDPLTSTITYVVFDESSHDALVIDPVLDFDAASGRVWDESLRKVLAFSEEKKLNLHYILETHAHADHLSGAQWLKKRYPKSKLAICARIKTVQNTFKKIFGITHDSVTLVRKKMSKFMQLFNLLRSDQKNKLESLFYSTYFPQQVIAAK